MARSICSFAIFVAPYVVRLLNGWSSVIGVETALPYTDADDEYTTRLTPASRHASTTFHVPSVLTSHALRGSATHSPSQSDASRNTPWTPFSSRRSASRSRTDASTTRTFGLLHASVRLARVPRTKLSNTMISATGSLT